MYTTIEALYDNGKIVPLKGKIKIKRGKVLVTIIESDEPEHKTERGELMAEALKKIADKSGLKSIKNPVSWQREVRKDKTLSR